MVWLRAGNHNLYRAMGVTPLLVAMLLLSAAVTLPAQERWEERSPQFVPVGRDDHMMAFDSDRGLVVMFGGDHAGSATWVWNGTDWKDLGIPGPPLTREAAMAYDSVRKVVVMFGGYDFFADSSATWEFDGEAWKGYTFETVPEGRNDHAMAFDAERGVMIMFGGEVSDDNTWAYDGEKWYIVNQEDNSPGTRNGHSMVYDSDRKVIVLFGGSDGNEFLDDTWEWDGEVWRDVTPEEGNPPGMRAFAMVYDSYRKRVVLFGGRDNELDGFDGTWEWDGTAWTQVDTTVAPSRRHECAAAYDSWRNRTVLFGGSSGSLEDDRYKDDTWWYPNNPPAITHDPVLGIFPAEPLKISADLIDYDGDDIDAFVFYRSPGETDYLSAKLEPESLASAGASAPAVYTVSIPADNFSADGVEYYIGARDPEGSRRWEYDGSGETPHKVTIGETGSIRLFIKPENARKAGARWRPKGTREWLRSGAVARGLEPGKLEIQFKTIRVKVWKKPEVFFVEIINGRRIAETAFYIKREIVQ